MYWIAAAILAAATIVLVIFTRRSVVSANANTRESAQTNRVLFGKVIDGHNILLI